MAQYFQPMNRSLQRQSLAVQQHQWENTAPSYAQTPFWQQPPPQHGAYASSTAFSTPSPPHIQGYSDGDQTRSPSCSPPEYSDLLYAPNHAAAIIINNNNSSSTRRSQRQSQAPSRPASAATGASSRSSRTSSTRPSPERQRPRPETASHDSQVGCFVIESMPGGVHGVEGGCSVLSAPLPMEVPLRATQASGDMRKMMNVFRLNPFAMQNHNGGGDPKRSGSICSSDSSSSSGSIDSSEDSPPPFEAKPLEEEPQMIEFQVHLDDPELLVPEHDRTELVPPTLVQEKHHPTTISPLSSPPLPGLDVSAEDALHSFPDDFDLHRESYDTTTRARTSTNSWGLPEYVAPSSASYASWDPTRDGQSTVNLRPAPPPVYLRKTARSDYQQYHHEPIPHHYSEPEHHQHPHQQHQPEQPQNPAHSPRSRTESPFATSAGDQISGPHRNLSLDSSDLFTHAHSQTTTTFYPTTPSSTSTNNTTASPHNHHQHHHSHRRWSFPAAEASSHTSTTTSGHMAAMTGASSTQASQGVGASGHHAIHHQHHHHQQQQHHTHNHHHLNQHQPFLVHSMR